MSKSEQFDFYCLLPAILSIQIYIYNLLWGYKPITLYQTTMRWAPPYYRRLQTTTELPLDATEFFVVNKIYVKEAFALYKYFPTTFL